MEKPPEDAQDMLSEVWRLTKDNNRLLRAMRRDALIMSIIKILVWGALIGGSIYFSLKYLEPLFAPQAPFGEQGQQEAMRALLELYNGNIPLPE